MNEILEMVGLFAVVFAVSMGISYVLTMKKRGARPLVGLRENTSVRMVGPGGIYRCHYLRSEKEGLVFGAPLMRDSYVPLRVGESMMVQAPVDGGLVTFRSEVVGRNGESHEFTVAHPLKIRESERRAEMRDRSMMGSRVLVNGLRGSLVDFSAYGARVLVLDRVEAGDVVEVVLPEDLGTGRGWVLDSTADAWEGKSARNVRVRFEEPIDGLLASRRRHLYLG